MTAERIETLCYAVRWRVLLKYLGMLGVSTTRTYAWRIAIVYGALTGCAVRGARHLAGGRRWLRCAGTQPERSLHWRLFHLRRQPGGVGARCGRGDHGLFVAGGGVAAPLLPQLAERPGRRALQDPELRALIVATAVLGALLTLWMPAGDGGWLDALMLSMSTQSTTRFSTIAIGDLDEASRLAMIGAMLVGGSVGSTAGGFKLLRLLLLLRLLQLVAARAAAPRHAVIEAWFGGRRVDDADLWRATLLMVMFALLVSLSWLAFVAHGYPALDALFEVVSAIGTVGLSTGITRADLEPLLKAILCFDMLAGRVEIFALLMVLYPGTWFGKRSEA